MCPLHSGLLFRSNILAVGLLKPIPIVPAQKAFAKHTWTKAVLVVSLMRSSDMDINMRCVWGSVNGSHVGAVRLHL